MRTRPRIGIGALGISAVLLLGSGVATAQDANLQSHIEEFDQRYEAAVVAKDWDTLASMFVEDATFLPEIGGVVEGRDAIRSYYEAPGEVKALDIHSSGARTVGAGLDLDIGTFTVTIADEAGDINFEGEYVALLQDGASGFQIVNLTTFPTRQAPDSPA